MASLDRKEQFLLEPFPVRSVAGAAVGCNIRPSPGLDKSPCKAAICRKVLWKRYLTQRKSFGFQSSQLGAVSSFWCKVKHFSEVNITLRQDKPSPRQAGMALPPPPINQSAALKRATPGRQLHSRVPPGSPCPAWAGEG